MFSSDSSSGKQIDEATASWKQCVKPLVGCCGGDEQGEGEVQFIDDWQQGIGAFGIDVRHNDAVKSGLFELAEGMPSLHVSQQWNC